MALDAATVLARYKTGMQGAGAKYTQGIQAVTVNPMSLAADAVDNGTWLQRVTAAAPKMSAKLRATPIDVWKNAAATYGAQAFTGSVTKAGQNFGKVVQQVVAAGASARSAAAAVPKTDYMGRISAAIAATKAAWGHS